MQSESKTSGNTLQEAVLERLLAFSYDAQIQLQPTTSADYCHLEAEEQLEGVMAQ